MRRFYLLPLFAVLYISLSVQAQTPNRKLLEDLLDLPAPPAAANPYAAAEYPPEFYSKKNVPPDDAPLAELLAYWSMQNGSTSQLSYNIKPSAAVAQRLMQACLQNPEILVNYLNVLPESDTAAMANRFFDDEALRERYDPTWQTQLENWLKFNTDRFSSELLNKAQAIKDENEYVTNQNELLALAKVDWNSARPIVERLNNDASQPVASTLAKWALYRHAVSIDDKSDADKYREQLKSIVEDRAAPAGKRDLAMDALMQSEDWDGRDQWYLSLLDDETLFDLRVNGTSYTGLTTLIKRSPPDKWIPPMIKLVNSSNKTVRRAAVRNLVEFLEENRPDVIEALLPWLSNPKWADEVNNERSRLLYALTATEVPASVPGLIQVVMTEESQYRSMAAQALAKNKSPQAISALNYALSVEKDEGFRISLIEALIANGGISDDDQMAALEAYAALMTTPDGANLFSGGDEHGAPNLPENIHGVYLESKLLPLPISIGRFLSEQIEPSDGLATRAALRLKALRKTQPATAKILSEIMQKWQGHAIYSELMRQIGDSSADLETIVNALAKRRQIREQTASEVLYLLGQSGLKRGIGAAISENENEMIGVLRQNDADAKIALLAGARLVRASLPAGEVGALLTSPDKTLALAAERWLEADDSAEARRLILARRAGEAVILGARTAFIPNSKKSFNEALLSSLFESTSSIYFGDGKFPALEKAEEKLRAEALGNPELQSIFAVLPADPGAHSVVRVYKDKVTFTVYENAARFRERTLSADEFESFYRFLIEKQIDAISSPAGECTECAAREFVMFSRNGGRRIFYYFTEQNHPFNELEKFFASFREGDGKLHYYLSDKLKNLEVLLADTNFDARAVWKSGADFRLLVEDNAKKARILADLAAEEKSIYGDPIDEGSYEARQKIYEEFERKREQLKTAHLAWRKVENGKLGAPIAPPPDTVYSFERLNSGENPDALYEEGRAQSPSGKTSIFSGYLSERGLWKTAGSQEPLLIRQGWFLKPLISANEKWVIAAKADESWIEPMSVVRINLQTKKEFKIALPPADRFYPVAAIPSTDKILLYRARNEQSTRKNNPSPKTPEYYLLDPNTGVTLPVRGELRPLEHQSLRPLQPTGNTAEFWAAIFSAKTNATEIGRYELKTFSFKPVMQIPEIDLDSKDVWIDEAGAKIYIVYQGHLLALPFASGSTVK